MLPVSSSNSLGDLDLYFVFVKCVLWPFYRAEVSQKLLLRDRDPFCFCKMCTIVFLSSRSDLEVTSTRHMYILFL